MLGWHISVFRQLNDSTSPARIGAPEGAQLAVWQTDCGGLDWIDDLVKSDKAICLSGGGYPNLYTATAENLIPCIEKGPPGARRTWACGVGDILTDKWVGRTVVNRASFADCRPDEWLLVEAWDES